MFLLMMTRLLLLLLITITITISIMVMSSISVSAAAAAAAVTTDRANNGDVVTTMMKGVHICIYVHDFKGLYNRLSDHSLIWTNPRFTRLDSCDTWKEAKNSRTLRFRYIIDINDNDNDQSDAPDGRYCRCRNNR
mmetsp:Transcript_36726/g.39859  ORF Transcript_36726/g.39859 Transcript_36726/m.39859 type:complete len:135 (-) Transcript_36726:1694-2098(-)